ncbi:MAG: HD domain-containing protein, partial [Anaerolineales bacterium]|nr:HD domain-containing protein [Anaerolineales bacterium]
MNSTMDFAAYAGRWVALVGEQVAGVGLTPEEAVQVARRNRSKDRFVLRFVDAQRGELLPLSPLVGRIRPFLQQYPQPMYLVGGAVRDLLLGRVAHDLDFVVPDGAIRLAFQVADQFGVPAYALDRERDTGRVVLQAEQTTFDFARFRGEDLEADLRARDFTINAMALPVGDVSTANLIDPCDGQTDLAERQICLTHADALQDDPVRALRAVRLAAELDFTLSAETETAVQEAASLLHLVSHERIRDELLRLMQTAVPDAAVAAMHRLGLLTAVLPEVAELADVEQSPPHFEPVLAHTLHVVAWLVKLEAVLFAEKEAADPALHAVRTALFPWFESLKAHFVRVVDGVNVLALLRLAGLFHDVGKKSSQVMEANGRIRFIGHEKVSAEETAHRLRVLCMSNHTIDHVQRIVRHHMRLFS